ncbi:Os05g0492500 [Oryza sativa Japonica Group]|uniref:Os05g0492500 protein n=2 Tax=Oryza sativa subsp. japonica TaxID=39947 RepID=Q0DH43_ORYSJ|nr:hypothetical protein EE612_030343 [Oryza sativa]BAF17830.1 Os05g0492500 [Oryza sativa Japonica Group]BAS94676.1 Os05g0492500 [Oryza sativa Japonica Group]|eukprot:NP_001055916.1 Os05g0492500 [Oryza sativa Japonica Group]
MIGAWHFFLWCYCLEDYPVSCIRQWRQTALGHAWHHASRIHPCVFGRRICSVIHQNSYSQSLPSFSALEAGCTQLPSRSGPICLSQTHSLCERPSRMQSIASIWVEDDCNSVSELQKQILTFRW